MTYMPVPILFDAPIPEQPKKLPYKWKGSNPVVNIKDTQTYDTDRNIYTLSQAETLAVIRAQMKKELDDMKGKTLNKEEGEVNFDVLAKRYMAILDAQKNPNLTRDQTIGLRADATFYSRQFEHVASKVLTGYGLTLENRSYREGIITGSDIYIDAFNEAKKPKITVTQTGIGAPMTGMGLQKDTQSQK